MKRENIGAACRLLYAPCAVFVFFVLCADPAFAGAERFAYVRHVIDGDTIILKNGERIRYLGIDSPERGEPYYDEARKRNIALCAGKRLRLVVCGAEPKDRYGRTLAWVWAGDTFVNAALLEEGLAKSMIIAPCGIEKEAEFKRLEKTAQGLRRGLWSLKSDGAEGVITIPSHEARNYIGKAVKVLGAVSDVHKTRNAVFIDFGGTRQRAVFRAVIFRGSFDEFSAIGIDPFAYRGKTMTVQGVIKDYKGTAEIIVKLPTQVEIK